MRVCVCFEVFHIISNFLVFSFFLGGAIGLGIVDVRVFLLCLLRF